MLDDALRSSCFASLDVLCAKHGEDIPYREGLDQGFPYRGARVPFLSRFKGIHRAAAQEGPAALSINTSASSPYDDEEIADGFLYAYRSGSADQPDNRALRAAFELQTPLVYFVATRPGWYKPLYPCYVIHDDPGTRRVLVAPGHMIGPLDDREAAPASDPLERKYAVRETRVRLHQAGFSRTDSGRVREPLRDMPPTRDAATRCRPYRRRPREAWRSPSDEWLQFVLSTTVRSIRISLASQMTTACMWRGVCSTTKTARCSISLRRFTKSKLTADEARMATRPR